MKLAWGTDIHLDHADDQARSHFAKSIVDTKADALLLTGDVASAKRIDPLIRELQKRIEIPIYFNLGNHDYYGGSIRSVNQWAKEITKSKTPIHWIDAAGIVELSDGVCLVGVDGWGDAQLGDPIWSRVLLNDWDLIEDFSRIFAMDDKTARIKLLQKLGQTMARSIRRSLSDALPRFHRILLMTHVPPWKEATWHEGAHSNDEWLPWFSCKAVGDAIVEEVTKHPSVKITVICGHTHGRGHSKINEQIDVYTGGARYQNPEVQCVFEVSNGEISRIAPDWFTVGYGRA